MLRTAFVRFSFRGILAFAAIALGPQAGYAQISLGPTCESIFESLPSIENRITNPVYGMESSDAVRLRAMIERAGSNEAELTLALTTAYLVMRLHNELPEVQALAVVAMKMNMTGRESMLRRGADRGSHYEFGSGRMGLAISKEQMGQLISGFLFAHELEHLIQDIKVGSQRMIQLFGSGRISKSEEAAMRAEFAFLRLIPVAIRQRILSELRSAQIESTATLRVFTGGIEISLGTSDADVYVRTMWKYDRYRPETEPVSLRTQRLQVDALNISATQKVLELWRDPRIRATLGSAGKWGHHQIFNMLSRSVVRVKDFTKSAEMFFGIHHEGELIGSVSLARNLESRFGEMKPVFVIGYALSPAHQGNGYAREAVERVVKFAFAEGSAESVYATTYPGNFPSISLLTKIGFIEVESGNNGTRKFEITKQRWSSL